MYRLAPRVSIRSSARGDHLVASRPLRAVRLNRPLRALLDRIPLAGVSPAEKRALESLAERGFLEREPVSPPFPERLPAVSVVIPAKDRPQELGRCLRSLDSIEYPRDRLEIIVVDDGSRDATFEVARSLGAVVVPSGGRGLGPALARNRGVAAAKGEILAFVDSDCTASSGWLIELVGAFEETGIAAVGGRVDGMYTSTSLDRYEAAMSSLSLGVRERSGGHGDGTFYLPSCNLLVRRRAFLETGGFHEGMRVGEDVDLSYRLRDRGWKIRYLPRGRVRHEHRNRLGAFLRRRFEYGTSEAVLQVLHPSRRKKLAVPALLGTVLALLALGALGGGLASPILAAGVLGADVLCAQRRLARSGLRVLRRETAAARLRALGSLAFHLGAHGLRYYGPFAFLAALVWPRFGLFAVAAALAVGCVEREVRKPRVSRPAFLLFHLSEQLAYAAGVFWGCVRQGSFASYRAGLYRRPRLAVEERPCRFSRGSKSEGA